MSATESLLGRLMLKGLLSEMPPEQAAAITKAADDIKAATAGLSVGDAGLALGLASLDYADSITKG